LSVKTTEHPEPGVAPADSERLLRWYSHHARRLPWRDDPSPYRVLLSELMLQQTRVDTVIPYFLRFVERWPTLEALASATEDDVLAAWSGLGYYRRARHLHKAARQATAEGGLMGDVRALRALPGVGPYTAGAVASIAFGVPTPAIDGNVERVITRRFGIDDDPKTALGRRRIIARVEGLLVADRAADLTSALMELGALVCTPKRASCEGCPWADRCVAYRTGRVSDLPNKRPKSKPKPIIGVAGLLEHPGGGLWMGRRPPGLLGAMWEPIGALVTDDPMADDVVGAFRGRAGLVVTVGKKLGSLTHVFSHRRLTLHVWEVSLVGRAGPPDGSYTEVRPVPWGEEIALSTLAKRTLAMRAPRSRSAVELMAAEADLRATYPGPRYNDP